MRRRKFMVEGAMTGAALLYGMRSGDALCFRRKVTKTDTHVHLFNLDEINYPWLEKATEIKRRYEIHAYQEATKRANIGKFVFMESGADPAQSLKEIEWVISQAEKDDRLAGIIARADFDQHGHLTPSIDQLTRTPWVKGIRGRISEEMFASPAFVEAHRNLGKHGLSADILLHPPQVKTAIKAFSKCPDTVIVLDHLVHPKIAKGEIVEWKKCIDMLSELPHLHCKVSGAINFAGDEWNVATIKPCVLYIIEKFGFDRIVYGGDWPNSLRFSDHYMDWARAFEKITKGFSAGELRKLYHENADRVYRL